MIKLDLGVEPSDLTDARAIYLPLAVAAVNDYGVGTDELADVVKQGYGVARPELYKRQYRKCAFCEKLMDKAYSPVEHFRPKGGAQDLSGSKWVMEKTHYWWLAWTWSNLYFSCAECNLKKHKGNKFPIKSSTKRIDEPPAPVTFPIANQYFNVKNEQNLLLDPREDDPFKHLEWNPVDRRKPKVKWIWTILGRDKRGSTTIDVLKLKRRVDEVNDHLDAIRLAWGQIDGHLRSGRLQDARAVWMEAITKYVNDPKKPYRNAVWCALNSLCDAPERTVLGFAEPLQPSITYVAPIDP